jgi:bifunctional non-homologous end joining protein LigD
MKLDDKFASKSDILKKVKSVRTGRTLKQVAQDEQGEKNSTPRKSARARKTPAAAAAKKKGEPAGKKARFPANLKPMFASLVEKPFNDEGWLYEIKWDGYRALAYLNKEKITLKSRNNKSFNERFFPITEALRELKINAVLDGEIVVIGEKGESRFGDLQNWRSEKDGRLVYYVFDLLWHDGYNLMHLPLSERRTLLEEIIPKHPVIRLSESFETSGVEFYEAAKKMNIEGIMAKKADSDYKPGYRSREWLKIKTNKRQEVVIGGYTLNEGTSKPFSALLAGVYDKKGRLIYTGRIGTGFSIKTQKEMLRLFKPLLVKKNPFSDLPDLDRPGRFRPNPPRAEVRFLKPQLVCEVTFTELTSEGLMRHPSFEGMRDDKKAREIVLEKPVSR